MDRVPVATHEDSFKVFRVRDLGGFLGIYFALDIEMVCGGKGRKSRRKRANPAEKDSSL